MGLPVLTCVGDTFASRVAGSLLKAAGLHELITYTLADYENKALSLTKTPQALNTIKQKLMSEKMTSALFDTAKFSRSLELIYKDIQTNHLNQNPNV
jgi:predicted O-linked N-acetylglucosamine transferase (SPINDLY family)